MKKLLIHCDDYALSINTSNDICACISNNNVDSVSILPNMKCFDKTIVKLDKFKNLKKVIHLNLLEGYCLSDKNKIKHLVNDKGLFKLSWVKLFFYSFNIFKYNEVKNEIKIEINAQIKKMLPYVREINIDSHQHTHTIPIVSKALFEVIKENNYELNYIRISKEPNLPYIKHIFRIGFYKPKYILSHTILNFLSIFLIKKVKKYNIKYTYLFGPIVSGNTNIKTFNILKKDIKKYSIKHDYEILFHPGLLLNDEISTEFNKKDFIKFHVSNNRIKEKESINTLNID